MGSGELAAIFRGLAADAARSAKRIADSIGHLAETTADIEETNVDRLLETDARVADSFDSLRSADRAQAGGWSGAGYIERSTPEAEAAYAAIRANTGDVSSIARNTAIDKRIVAQVKNHLFMTEHDVPIGPHQIAHGYFTPNDYVAELWNKAERGSLSKTDQNDFRSLLAHEYVESRLMEDGMPYRSADPATWEDGRIEFNLAYVGAHEVAPLSSTGSLRLWPALGLTPPERPLAPDLSNIDDVVNAARKGLGR